MPSVRISETYSIKYLTKDDISKDYLDTLNDIEYMRYSENARLRFTRETQENYVDSFDFDKTFLLAVMNNSELISTATLRLDLNTQTINIGFLMLKKYSGQGRSYEVFRAISKFTFRIFPQYNQEVGTRIENHAMINVALNAGFMVNLEKSTEIFRYFIKASSFNLSNLKQELLGALVVANDAGGASQIACLALELDIRFPALISGPAVKIFENLAVNYEIFDNATTISNLHTILTGTGIYGGPESIILEEQKFKSLKKISLLDNWVNYSERFDPNRQFLPDTLLVTNSLSRKIASTIFPNSNILQIPDFYLARQMREYLKLSKVSRHLLVILEPESKTSLAEIFKIKKIEDYLTLLIDQANAYNVSEIILRPHPSQDLHFEELQFNVHSKKINFRISRDSLIQDIANASAVFGFNSYALYLSMNFGVETHGFFAHLGLHWTNQFEGIREVSGINELL